MTKEIKKKFIKFWYKIAQIKKKIHFFTKYCDGIILSLKMSHSSIHTKNKSQHYMFAEKNFFVDLMLNINSKKILRVQSIEARWNNIH